MLNPIKGGSVVLVRPEPDADPIECHIPPEGYGIDSEGKLVHVGVYRANKIFSLCKWERDPRWKQYNKWKEEEDKVRKSNPQYSHPDLTKFVNDCWKYRECGFWFYKNDKPTYINGDFWFFLSIITMENGQYPKYRDSDRLYFYFWQYCEEHPACLGMLYITMRRDGKCLGFNTPIRMYDGSLKMVQDIVEGDIVMGVNSQPRKAFGITSGREEMFDVIYEGGSFGCNISHILSLKNKNGDTCNISVRELIANWVFYNEYYLYNNECELFSFSIKSIGEGDYYGFAVDGDHLFLLGDGIVTHNSYKAGSIALNRATKTENFKAGIQSKGDTDSEGLFKKAIIQPYRKFPYFFEVAKSNIKSNGKVPKNELLFSSNKASEIDEELSSKIDFRSAGNFAYDGNMLNYYIADEVGKPQPPLVDINKRLGVVEFCLKDFEQRIIGKTMHTSTVEDNSGASEKLKKMWDASDVHEVLKNGKSKTQTGMFRYFKPAQEVLIVDEYGDVDVLKGLEKIMADREVLKDNPRRLHELKTKIPTSVKEAFMTSSEKCVFNPAIIEQRTTELTWHKGDDLYKRGNWAWVDEEWGDVKFVENPNGQVYLIEDVIEELRNRKGDRHGFKYPHNSHIYSMGVDTYDHKIRITTENESELSDGSFSVIKKPTDTFSTDMDNGLVCYFRHRYENPERFYRDCIMTMLYFGCEALIERNKPALINYMTKLGLEMYCTLIEGQTQRGIHTSDITNNNIFELTDQYITDYCDKINVINLIDDWAKFDPSNTTVFDGAMSFGLALIQWDKKKPKKTTKSKISEISQIFDANDMLGAVKFGGIDTDLKFT